MNIEIYDENDQTLSTVVVGSLEEAISMFGPRCRLSAHQPAASPELRLITTLAFRNRFTPSEKSRIELAAIHDYSKPKTDPANVLAAALRAKMADQRDAEHINLDREDARDGVQELESSDLLDAAGRALEILDAPIQPHEVFRG